MDGFILSGRIADLILALVALEALALWLVPRLVPAVARVLPPLGAIWPTLLSGACLVVALRFALGGAGWVAVAGALLAALVAHTTDLVLRARRL